jgi:polynucleotide 5'-hydroxyl-kinase GRC3/NOL9
MQTLSYFHLNWPSITTPHPTWDPTPLTDLRPWRVRYRGPSKGFLGILCYDHQPGPHLLAEAITGMILALVKIESQLAFRDLLGSDPSAEMDVDVDTPSPTPQGIIPTPEGIPLIQNPLGRTLDPRYSSALGLVLIRGIDTQRGELQVLTPLPAETFASIGKDLVLVAGRFDTPNWAYAEDLYLRAFMAGKNNAAGESSGAATPARSGMDESSDEEDEEEDVREVEKSEDAAVIGLAQDEVPWVEALHGNQKKSVGSRVWRVRRDLGRN